MLSKTFTLLFYLKKPKKITNPVKCQFTCVYLLMGVELKSRLNGNVNRKSGNLQQEDKSGRRRRLEASMHFWILFKQRFMKPKGCWLIPAGLLLLIASKRSLPALLCTPG